MTERKIGALRIGHRKALGLANEEPAPQPKIHESVEKYYRRHELLRGIPAHIIRKAWFTMAHMLLQPGARVADMGCEDGTMAYAMAALNPQIHFTGIDIDKKKITKAKQTYKLPNLEFRAANTTSDTDFEKNSLDGIINSFVLHEIYSTSRYSERSVIRALENQFDLLKQDGIIFLRDYAMPNPGDFVMLEMPATRSAGEDVAQMSEPDLLVWYAERARSKENPGCHGFFMEELPPRFPHTRLFRLPHKWAYEFITRKDDRERLQADLHKEYAFFTEREFRKTLRALGARVMYSSPHWDDIKIKQSFEGHFRLYTDDGTPIGNPPTSFIAVAQKTGESRSLRLQERRPTGKIAKPGTIRITAMRNDVNGKIVDIVSRDSDVIEIIPYRVNENGLLNIFVHEGMPRGISNAVPRTGRNMDERSWSGHMTEAIGLPGPLVRDVKADDTKQTILFARDHLGLRPATACSLEDGPSFYPAPDYIDERIETRYLRVEARDGPMFDPKHAREEARGFTSAGKIREVSAQSVLDAVAVGIIPNARLELQILALYEKLGLKAESWNECPLVIKEEEPERTLDIKNFMKKKSMNDNRFKSVRGTTGHIRAVQSVFVDEGWVEGGISGMASRDMEFIIHDEKTLNVAVILPLTKNLSGEVLAGITTDYMPIPQRYTGNGLTMTVPSFVLPKEVTDLESAKRFIAEKFEIPPDNVARLGESYFCHVGLTPQRVFPFAITGVARKLSRPIHGMTNFAPLKYLWVMKWWDMDTSLLKTIAYAYRRFGQDSDIGVKFDFTTKLAPTSESPAVGRMEDLRGADINGKGGQDAEKRPNPR